MKIETGNNQTKNIRAVGIDAKTIGIWRRTVAVVRQILRLSRRAPRRLRLCESLPLGDRRFVAVVEFECSRFLLGGTAGSLVLLARLEGPSEECPGEECIGKETDNSIEAVGSAVFKLTDTHLPAAAEGWY